MTTEEWRSFYANLPKLKKSVFRQRYIHHFGAGIKRGSRINNIMNGRTEPVGLDFEYLEKAKADVLRSLQPKKEAQQLTAQ